MFSEASCVESLSLLSNGLARGRRDRDQCDDHCRHSCQGRLKTLGPPPLVGALGVGGQEEGSGPGGRGVEGHRGPSRPEVDPLDPSGLQVVGAHMGRSQDAGDHGEGPEVVASQGVAAQDSRASATKTIRSIIFHGIIGFFIFIFFRIKRVQAV